jgi:hypothetical protein
MVAYNFQRRFAVAVEQGDKRQTIRAQGKRRHAAPGDKLQLYTGMRTKACRKLGDATCYDVCLITIYEDWITTMDPPEVHSGADLEQWAHKDGFSSWPEMRDWFAKVHGLPFTGVLIRWEKPLRPSPRP